MAIGHKAKWLLLIRQPLDEALGQALQHLGHAQAPLTAAEGQLDVHHGLRQHLQADRHLLVHEPLEVGVRAPHPNGRL